MKKAKPISEQQQADINQWAEFATIDLTEIEASPTNPRKTFPAESLDALSKNIKRVGILQAVVIRPWPDHYAHDEPTPTFELVAGERRWRAAKLAGLTDIPAVIRDLTDSETLEIQVIENLQRENPHELEEADGYELLMQRHGYSVDMLADKVNRSKAYIYARLKLTALVTEAREAFYAGGLNASTALLVARIPLPDMQRQAVKKIAEGEWGGGPMSARNAAEYVRRVHMLKLSTAPFPPDTRDLVTHAPNCDECPKRTGNQPEIYPDTDADVCTDPVCFGYKKSAHQARLIEEAKSAGQQVFVGDEAKKIAPYGECTLKKGYVNLDVKNHDLPGEQRGKTYREILGADYVAPALVENGGKMIQVARIDDIADALKAKGIKIGPSHAEQQKEQDRQTKSENIYRDRLFDAIHQHNERVSEEIKSQLGDQITGVERTPIGMGHEDYVLVVTAFFDRTWHEHQKRLARKWLPDSDNRNHDLVSEFQNTIPTLRDERLSCLLIELALIGEISIQSYGGRQNPEKMISSAARNGIDSSAIRKQVMNEAKDKAKNPAGKKSVAKGAEDAATERDAKTVDMFEMEG